MPHPTDPVLQIQDLRDEVRQNSYLLTMPHPTDPPPTKRKRSSPPRHAAEEAHLRHTGHHFKKELDHLRRRMEAVEKRQEQLQTELLLLKKQERGLEDQVEEKLPVPETVSNTSAIAKLHASTVQLFEALETLETKVDREVGELQREVSKVESGAAKVNAALQEVREARSEQDEQLKAHARSITALQNRAANTTLWLARLETEHALRHTGDLLREPRSSLAEEVREIRQDSLRLSHDVTLLVEQLPKDCSARESKTSGAFLMHLPGLTQQVFCDEDWTVVHRRVDDSEDFDRDWNAYKSGFGDRTRNFWVGNDFLHLLTQSGNYTLRVDMWDTTGVYRYAQYASVAVHGEEDNFRLQLDGFHGNASDALAYHNQMNFSTADRDRDQSASSNCAQYYGSGWWYNQCQYVNLNGHFARGITWFDREAHEWLQLGRAEMRLKPR